MKKAVAEFIVEITGDIDSIEVSIYEDYATGHKVTTGVISSCTPFQLMSQVIASAFADPLFDADSYTDVEFSDFKNLRCNSLGSDYVIY